MFSSSRKAPVTLAQTGNNTTEGLLKWKNTVLESLSKLADKDTQRTAVDELSSTAETLDAERLPIFIHLLLETCDNYGIIAHKEALRVIAIVGSIFQGHITPFLPRILTAITKRLRDPKGGQNIRQASSEVVGVLARYVPPLAPGHHVSDHALGAFMKPLFGGFVDQEKNTQNGLAECIGACILNARPDLVTNDTPRLVARIIRQLKHPNTKAKGPLLIVLGNIAEVIGESMIPQIPSVINHLFDALASSDWQIRKAGAETLAIFATNVGPAMDIYKTELVTILEDCRYDKVPPVRSAMTKCLELIRVSTDFSKLYSPSNKLPPPRSCLDKNKSRSKGKTPSKKPVRKKTAAVISPHQPKVSGVFLSSPYKSPQKLQQDIPFELYVPKIKTEPPELLELDINQLSIEDYRSPYKYSPSRREETYYPPASRPPLATVSENDRIISAKKAYEDLKKREAGLEQGPAFSIPYEGSEYNYDHPPLSPSKHIVSPSQTQPRPLAPEDQARKYYEEQQKHYEEQYLATPLKQQTSPDSNEYGSPHLEDEPYPSMYAQKYSISQSSHQQKLTPQNPPSDKQLISHLSAEKDFAPEENLKKDFEIEKLKEKIKELEKNEQMFRIEQTKKKHDETVEFTGKSEYIHNKEEIKYPKKEEETMELSQGIKYSKKEEMPELSQGIKQEREEEIKKEIIEVSPEIKHEKEEERKIEVLQKIPPHIEIKQEKEEEIMKLSEEMNEKEYILPKEKIVEEYNYSKKENLIETPKEIEDFHSGDKIFMVEEIIYPKKEETMELPQGIKYSKKEEIPELSQGIKQEREEEIKKEIIEVSPEIKHEKEEETSERIIKKENIFPQEINGKENPKEEDLKEVSKEIEEKIADEQAKKHLFFLKGENKRMEDKVTNEYLRHIGGYEEIEETEQENKLFAYGSPVPPPSRFHAQSNQEYLRQIGIEEEEEEEEGKTSLSGLPDDSFKVELLFEQTQEEITKHISETQQQFHEEQAKTQQILTKDMATVDEKHTKLHDETMQYLKKKFVFTEESLLEHVNKEAEKMKTLISDNQRYIKEELTNTSLQLDNKFNEVNTLFLQQIQGLEGKVEKRFIDVEAHSFNQLDTIKATFESQHNLLADASKETKARLETTFSELTLLKTCVDEQRGELANRLLCIESDLEKNMTNIHSLLEHSVIENDKKISLFDSTISAIKTTMLVTTSELRQEYQELVNGLTIQMQKFITKDFAPFREKNEKEHTEMNFLIEQNHVHSTNRIDEIARHLGDAAQALSSRLDSLNLEVAACDAKTEQLHENLQTRMIEATEQLKELVNNRVTSLEQQTNELVDNRVSALEKQTNEQHRVSLDLMETQKVHLTTNIEERYCQLTNSLDTHHRQLTKNIQSNHLQHDEQLSRQDDRLCFLEKELEKLIRTDGVLDSMRQATSTINNRQGEQYSKLSAFNQEIVNEISGLETRIGASESKIESMYGTFEDICSTAKSESGQGISNYKRFDSARKTDYNDIMNLTAIGHVEAAYSTILQDGDPLNLFRLMENTGPVLDKLKEGTIVLLADFLIPFIKAGNYLNTIFPVITQLCEKRLFLPRKTLGKLNDALLDMAAQPTEHGIAAASLIKGLQRVKAKWAAFDHF